MKKVLLLSLLIVNCSLLIALAPPAHAAYASGQSVVMTKQDFDMCLRTCLYNTAAPYAPPAAVAASAPAPAQSSNGLTPQQMADINAAVAAAVAASAPAPAPTPAPTPAPAPVTCKSAGYYVENGQCRPKTFSFSLFTRAPGIPSSVQCVFKDTMLRDGFIGDFPDECALPLVDTARLGLTQFTDYCSWNDMDRPTVQAQQRVVNFIINMPGGWAALQNGQVFRVKTMCFPKNSGTKVDFY